MKRIAVLTSGGDSPGMNAAIRAVVRKAIACNFHAVGVRNGYSGLLAAEFMSLPARSVGNIMQLGGTFLGSSRSPEFVSAAGQELALRNLQAHAIDALIVIGGNGSQAGAYALSTLGFPVVGVASTIDNDLFGTDVSIGTTTALDIALESIDRLRVTASSHHRAFLVEVMGRASGYLALMAGLAGGAECIIVPEIAVEPEIIATQLREGYLRGKRHAICVVAEGAAYNAEGLAAYFKSHRERLGFDLRVTKLGHVQRGGHPNAFDRILATQLGAAAIDCLADGQHGMLIGKIRGDIVRTPLEQVMTGKKTIDSGLFELARILAQ